MINKEVLDRGWAERFDHLAYPNDPGYSVKGLLMLGMVLGVIATMAGELLVVWLYALLGRW